MHERKKRADHNNVTDKVKLSLDVFPPASRKKLKLYRLRGNNDSSINPLKLRERNAGEVRTGGLEHLNKLNQYIDREHEEPEPIMEEAIHVIKPWLEKLIRRDEERLQPLNDEVSVFLDRLIRLFLVTVRVADKVISLLRGFSFSYTVL